MTKAIHKLLTAKIDRAADDADASMTISTPDVDREGDVLVPEGVVLDDYLKNPIVMFVHDHFSIPVGRTTHVNVVPGRGIAVDFVWLKNDAEADRVRNAFEQGVLNAASVGFMPLAYEPIATGYRYTKWALLEWSICPLPANPNATRVLKSLGLDEPHARTFRDDGADDDRIEMDEDELDRTIRDGVGRAIDSAVNAHLGRIDDGDDPTPATLGGLHADDRIEASEDDITRAVADVITEEINKYLGRVD
jgi:HK97 family phage prohead protease